MTTTRRTELVPFFLDLLDFMEEKIQEAVTDESSRACAVGEAAGTVPLLRDRLSEDETKKAQFILVFDEYLYGQHATRWWVEFASMDRASFEKQAASLVGPHGIFAVLRAIAAHTGIS